jgi:hypothetical protein
MTALLDFYRSVGPDAAGRTIDDVWAYDVKRLEMVHDFIQWLFPLPEPSRFNPDAPLLTPADIAAFRTDADLRKRALRSFDLMLRFYGLVRGDKTIARGSGFENVHWLTPLNHNHLRLTRILLFLRHTGFEQEALALSTCLADIAAHEGKGAISERTLAFWREATAQRL